MNIKQFQKLYEEHNPKGDFFKNNPIDDIGVLTGDCIHTDKATGKETSCYGIRHTNKNNPDDEKIIYTYFSQATFEIIAQSKY